MKEAAGGDSQQLGEGLVKEKSEGSKNFDGASSMFDVQSELPDDEDIPERYHRKLMHFEDQINSLNLSLKDKNEKILELLGELEDVKIQVYARDKSIEL